MYWSASEEARHTLCTHRVIRQLGYVPSFEKMDRLPHSTEDTDSDSRATNDDPTSPIAVNGLGSPNSTADTESLPSLESLPSPIVGRSSRNSNDYCYRTLLQTSSESMDELPTIPTEIIGGSVSDDSKYKYTVCEDSDSDLTPTTSQNSRMLSDLSV